MIYLDFNDVKNAGLWVYKLYIITLQISIVIKPGTLLISFPLWNISWKAYASSLDYKQNRACPSRWYTKRLLHVTEHGLPETSDPKHVIIIGVGIAGLTAGKLLKDAGHQVTILEASDRVGGRIYTYRDPQDRYYVDMGAMRIPDFHHFVNAFVKRFKLPTNPIVSYDGNTWCYINGRKVRSSKVNENPDILGYDTSPSEKGKTAAELVTEVILPNYFVEVGNLSRGAISMIGAVEELEKNYFTSIANYVKKVQFDTASQYEITGGMDLLPKAFLPSLEDNIVFNAKVNHVVHGNGSVVAKYLCNGTDVEVSGDYLLTTATAMATAFIRFTPELRSAKGEAFRNIHYLGATKVALVFEKPFWEDEGIHGGSSNTDLLSDGIYYPSHRFDSGLGVLIAAYASGDHSQKFLGLTDAECISQVLNDLAFVHGDHIRDIFVEGVVKRWQLDPFSNGAWAFPTPYQLRNYYDAIVRPTKELFFAGDDTSYPHGWVNTAIQSAVEAVHCIHDQICYPFLENEEVDESINSVL